MDIKKAITFWIFLFLVLVYVYLAKLTRFYYSPNSPFAYYNWLMEAFLKGRTYIENPPYILDVSLFKNKYYFYWGPAPLLFILPFYLWGGGLGASDFLYNLTAGIANIALFYFLLKEVVKAFSLKIEKKYIYYLWIAFGLGSPNLYCALNGGVWHGAQIIGIFYLLISLIFFFKFINIKSNISITASVLFFNLAWLSRYGMFFYIAIYIYAWFRTKSKHLLLVPIITILFIVGLALYNQTRFGNPFELGTRYMQTDLSIMRTEKDINENIFQQKMHQEGNEYSFAYIPRNVFYYFLNPVKFIFSQPYLITDSMGNGVFFIYPFFLLIFGFLTRVKQSKKIHDFLKYVFLICILYMSALLTFSGTGYHQVGNRYILDITPLILIAILFWIKKIPSMIILGLLIFGVFVNILAIIAYYLGVVTFW